jgi:hypothetical protein
MNKIIDSKKNILKICAGNDFSIVVQITEYDTETGAWVNYDLSAVSDVHMTLVAENGKHIKLPVVVNEDGTVSAPVQAAYLQKSTYGIELTWVTNDLNRRTYSPCLMQIVTTTAESSSNIAEYESNDAYHFNIKMQADVAVLSIGKISDEYVTEDEVDNKLENYVTNSALSTTLNDYATKQYVDDELANIDLTDYYTKSEINTTLESYVTDSELNTAISPFITNLDLSNVLENYVSNVALEQDLEDYAKFEDLSSYAKFEDLTSYATTQYVDNEIASIDLSSYVTYSYLDSKVDPIDARVTALENEPQVPSNVVTSYDGTYIYCLTQAEYDSLQQLDPDTFYYITDASTNYATLSDLTSYAKLSDLSSYAKLSDLSSYATTQYVDNEIASIDLSSYATTQYVDNEIASIDLSSYASLEDLSSYVTYTDWDNSNEAIAYELTNNRLAHLSINDNFNNYYTKTETDSRYATSSWANSNFVKQTDDINRQQAIAAAFASSVQSTYIHNIWSGSQNDYNQLTPDSYTLYIIL